MLPFDFSAEHVLENDVVKLRPLQTDDIDLLAPFSLEEPELWRFSLVPGDGLENLRSYVDAALKGRSEGHDYPFVVIDKRVSACAGSTRFYDYQEHHATTQLGFTWYGKRFQGSGLNAHCKFLLLEFAFETLALERVEFRADARNARSIAAMKSIGCTVEGILRSNCAGPTERRDSIILSILKEEWETGVKKRLTEKLG